ncbi:MAG TPA: efflux RND transporter periplasmic adaptor subunit [Polyangia bacterium]|jgi:multidrug efflux system membrane fusion protein
MRTHVLIAAALWGASLAAGCTTKAQGQRAATPPLVPVRAAVAQLKRVPNQVSVIGRVEALQTVIVRSQVAGTLQRIHFREGDEVKQGALLFTIDPRPFQAALRQARAQLAKDAAQAHNARVTAARYQTLAKQDLIPREQADNAAASSETFAAAVAADQAAVENARLSLAYCFIHSPIDGRTGNLIVTQGNLIKVNDVALVVINQMTPIAVTFSLPEGRLGAVRDAMARANLVVRARPPGEQRPPAVGRVSFLSNAVDPATGTILLKGTFDNRDRRLWPGQFAEATLILGTEDHVVVPAAAVQAGQSGAFVFVVAPDGTAVNRPVTAGETLGDEVVIERGVAAGEQVVTDGQLRLVPGARVAVQGS